MRTRLLLMVSLIFCFLVVSVGLHAQDYRGRVQGTVMDKTQAVVPGASVTLLNTKTGVAFPQKSNEVGHYIFDYVEPGSYELDVEIAGFAKFVQQNITVQAHGDVTVNATLKAGAVGESVVVEAAPVDVEFNSASVATTIDTRLANDLPSLTRNPFSTAALDPSVYNGASWAGQPFNSWSNTSIKVGGGSSYAGNSNDVLVDSTPIGLGAKASYTPPMDSVDQVVVQENPVDAAYGNSAGGVMQVVMKSGTNDWHGNTWYNGRYPFMQAVADRTTNSKNTTRQHMWGASLGNPVMKNKLFNYVVYEQWKMSVPSSWKGTMPTAAQAAGDFSATLNGAGTLATIYDPLTTVYDPSTGTSTRTAFAGNKIPSGRLDPVAVKIMKDIWGPNTTGTGYTNTDNFKSSFSAMTDYYNISDRVDYYINPQWHLYGRYNHFHTVVKDTFPINSPAFVDGDGSARDASTVSGDAIWTINNTTVLNLHGDYNSFVDGYQASKTLSGGYSSMWSNNWYSTFANDAPTLYPRMVINGTAVGSPWVYWYDSPWGSSYSATLTKQISRHYLKFGLEYRHQNNKSISYTQNAFNFSPTSTSYDYTNSTLWTQTTGNAYAGFLMGVMDNSSTVYTSPHKESRWNSFAGYVQDDFKLNKRLTLNVGLRYEYEAPLTDPQNRLGRYLDLSKANPTLAASPISLPSAAAAYNTSPSWNGYYNFSDANHPNMYDAPKIEILPRFGLAYKLDEKTAIRFGYGRFLFPFAKSNYNNSLGVAYPGLDASQAIMDNVLGVPQVFLQNPFPSSGTVTSPLVAPLGSKYGANYGLGSAVTWYKPNFTPGKFDRFSLSVQRQLPQRILVDVSLSLNIGTHLPLTYNANMANVPLYYSQKGTMATQVTNPFYQYGTTTSFPGTLRNSKTVSIYSLTRKYPAYGDLTYSDDIGADRYRSIQVKLQRPFASGYNFVLGYNFNREMTLQYWDDLNQYANHTSWREGTQPRHRITAASIYELPFGRGRKYMNHANYALDAVLGGWQMSGSFSLHSGEYLQFGSYLITGNPALSHRTKDYWFKTSAFAANPSYTPRTSQYTYPGLTGPMFWNLDMNLKKDFQIYERLKSQLTLSTFNASNRMNWANPGVSLTDTAHFGKLYNQNAFSQGRQSEIGLKLLF